VRLFGADSPPALARMTPFAEPSKPPLPVPPVATDLTSASRPEELRRKIEILLPFTSLVAA
jgi:hypothetical protein